MTYSPILLVHICAGTIGLLSGTAALSFRKGSPRHVLAGRVFVAAMLTMALSAVYVAAVKQQPNNIGGGLFTFYLILTAWLTARRMDNETERFDWALLLIPLVLGALAWISGVRALLNHEDLPGGVPVGMHLFMASIMLLAAAGDLRMILRRGVFGAARVVRHIWRMCFGLFIAAGSFFLGPSNRPQRLLRNVGMSQRLPAFFFSTGFYSVLTLLPLVLLVFWLVRVRLKSRFAERRQPFTTPT
jgi:uncharacterized membrane protein